MSDVQPLGDRLQTGQFDDLRPLEGGNLQRSSRPLERRQEAGKPQAFVAATDPTDGRLVTLVLRGHDLNPSPVGHLQQDACALDLIPGSGLAASDLLEGGHISGIDLDRAWLSTSHRADSLLGMNSTSSIASAPNSGHYLWPETLAAKDELLADLWETVEELKRKLLRAAGFVRLKRAWRKAGRRMRKRLGLTDDATEMVKAARAAPTPPAHKLPGYDPPKAPIPFGGFDPSTVNRVLLNAEMGAASSPPAADPDRRGRAWLAWRVGSDISEAALEARLERAAEYETNGDGLTSGGRVRASNLAKKELLRRQVERLRNALAGEDPTLIEYLLSERAALCWIDVHCCDLDVIAAERGGQSSRAAYHDRRRDRAHRRYLSALRSLASVRRQCLAAIQVNVSDISQEQARVASPGGAAALIARPAKVES